MPRGKDPEESARVAEAINARPMECYFNARRAIMKLADYQDACYIEGHAVLKSTCLYVEHAWVVRNGHVIDPTDVLLPGASFTHYFPGLEIRGRQGVEEFLSTFGRKYRRKPFFYAFGWGGSLSASFTASRDAARRHVFGPESDKQRTKDH